MEVFPDVWPAFELLTAMATQWRMGAVGPTGLDYGVLKDVGSVIGMSKKQIRKAFPDLMVMEAEALLVMSESK